MSQAAVRLRDPVDLEEFERKLRSAAPDPKQGGDPLQELSRLIGVQKDPLDQLFAEAKAPAASASNSVAMSGVAPRIDVAHIDERLFRPAGQPVSQPKAPFEDPADISALLNQFPDAAARFAAAAPLAAPAAQDHYNEPMPPFAEGYDEPSVGEPGYRSGYDEPRKSRRPLLLMGAALVVLIGGIGAVVVNRSHGPSGTPTIQASNTPVKVAPAASDTPDQAQQVSVLDKANTERLAASRVVTREEQPVDIRAQARVNGTASGVIAMPAAPSSGATNGNGLFPDPRPVKTVSVRPDGSVITGGDLSAPRTPVAPVASLTPSMTTNPPPVPVARPTAAPAPTPAAPKTTARATAAASVAAATPATATAAPAAQPQAEAAKPPVDRTASTNASGDFAVQLAAPGSEAEARQVMTRLAQRFGSELGGRKLTFKKAAVGDKSVYRVRISGLSRENATSLCTKLQAKGGNCFVAKN
ncbi:MULTISPECIES: SPOR domain-containing protein [unclassified Beijerinckia]|uniref:SPOR domain-containing protein n=1 Tax=unclassified Beijerinckia TaxID=2638183 RepID=UPI00089B1C57|nr:MULTISPECIES: SPOR domain-containing protein [unclassified Beijerinckia]MDH7795649.1 hypothetical protein [Beijerinckia sp. GAS462]SEC10192.1 Sporulation related domain-containing protein [Beijerinckia sp. 28-YEA-48]